MHNPIGYVVAFAMEFTWGFYVVCIVTSQTTFLIGSCWMFVSLAEDIASDLETMNKLHDNQRELTKKFMEFIELHSKAKQLRKICTVFFKAIDEINFTVFCF